MHVAEGSRLVPVHISKIQRVGLFPTTQFPDYSRNCWLLWVMTCHPPQLLTMFMYYEPWNINHDQPSLYMMDQPDDHYQPSWTTSTVRPPMGHTLAANMAWWTSPRLAGRQESPQFSLAENWSRPQSEHALPARGLGMAGDAPSCPPKKHSCPQFWRIYSTPKSPSIRLDRC